MMPSNTILKPDPAEDFYIVWINGAGGPGAWGSREVLIERMAQPSSGYEHDDYHDDRFDRADATGTSTIDDNEGPFLGRVVDGRAWIPRERMTAWCRAGLDRRFLEPTEDDRRRAAAAAASD
jgi:hypothetical protein